MHKRDTLRPIVKGRFFIYLLYSEYSDGETPKYFLKVREK